MKRIISFILIALMVLCNISVFAADINAVNLITSYTADYIYQIVNNPQVASIGGEWAVIGLARSGTDIHDEYYQNYYDTVQNYVEQCDGIMHVKKYTEYSRVILALTAIGKNPADVAGYNLLMPLGDYEKTIWQGINGSIWALIALDSNNYEIPQNPNADIQATREMYINHIVDNQNADGGWALSGDISDADVTAMALVALSKYQYMESVKSAIEKAVEFMSQNQKENGGFSSCGEENAESSAQMIVALCELGISIDDSRFVKNGNTILDNMLAYYQQGFKHTVDGTVNQMATEQCFLALSALKRFNEGKNSLYNMSDEGYVLESEDNSMDILDNNKISSAMYPFKTFSSLFAMRYKYFPKIYIPKP